MPVLQALIEFQSLIESGENAYWLIELIEFANTFACLFVLKTLILYSDFPIAPCSIRGCK